MYPIFLSPHGDRLLALSSSHSAFVFDVKTSGMLGTMDPAFNTALWSLIWAPDGKHVLTLYFGRCNLWDTTTGRWMGLLDGSGEIPKATFTPDSTRILASGSIYNVITGSDPDLKQAPSPVP
jgi:WD40 repeat protein